jgi:hypothetical protein
LFICAGSSLIDIDRGYDQRGRIIFDEAGILEFGPSPAPEAGPLAGASPCTQVRSPVHSSPAFSLETPISLSSEASTLLNEKLAANCVVREAQTLEKSIGSLKESELPTVRVCFWFSAFLNFISHYVSFGAKHADPVRIVDDVYDSDLAFVVG